MIDTKEWEIVRVEFPKSDEIRQGDIIRDVECIEEADEQDGIIEVSKIVFPYVLVMTQACDLAFDHECRFETGTETNQSKRLVSALVVPVYNADHVAQGSHLSELGYTMSEFSKSSRELKMLGENELPRYHVLRFNGQVSIPDSIIDFKHYFSVNIENLQRKKGAGFMCQVSPLYREKISQRFSNYLARIGLPEGFSSVVGVAELTEKRSGR